MKQNTDDLISIRAAIDALEKEKPTLFVNKDGSIDPFCAGRQNQWYRDGIAIMNLPSAQPVDKDVNAPVNDLISRQAAIDAMCELMHHWFGSDSKDEIREIKRELEKLPSAQPIDVHEAYYRGKIDGVKECTARLKKVTEEFANG